MKIMIKNGQRICVLRPATPELAARAVALAMQAAESTSAGDLRRIPGEIGDYTFQGYLAQGAPVRVNFLGERIGDTEPGDLFLEERQVVELMG